MNRRTAENPGPLPDGPGPLPDGPRPLPVVGWLGNALRYFRNPVSYLVELKKRFGDVVCLVDADHPTLYTRPAGGKARTVFGFGPECNRQILNQPEVFQTRRPRGPEFETYEQLSSNILFMNGEKHRQQRQILNPAFYRERLRSYHDDLIRFTEKMLEAWEDGEKVDLLTEMNRLTRNVASKALFGLEPFGASATLSSTMARIIDTLFSPATMIPINLPGMPFRRLRHDMKTVVGLLEAEIERKRRSGSRGSDVLTRLIQAHDENAGRLTDAELVSQSFVMFFAGHHISMSALTTSFFLLAQHPDAAAALLDELDSRLGGAAPTYEQIYELPVLDRVVKESLRVLGPAIAFPRVAAEATVLGAYEIPAGCEVLFSPYITHHDAEIYPQPERFLPDRWLTLKPSLFEYLPFGAGVRRCLGFAFGGMLLRTVIATVVQRFRLEMVPGARIDISVDVTMAPKQMPMVIRPQDREFRRSKAEVGGFIRQMVELD